jgi:hypothetical protein
MSSALGSSLPARRATGRRRSPCVITPLASRRVRPDREIDPAPVYKCGSRTGVANLLIGCNVWITADGMEVGRVDGAVQHQGVKVTPDYGLGQQVRAWASMCDDPSPPSVLQVT